MDDDATSLKTTGCFDARCAPPAVAAFSCGGGGDERPLGSADLAAVSTPSWLLDKGWKWDGTKILLWVVLLCCCRLFAVEYEAFDRVATYVAAAATGDGKGGAAALGPLRQALAEACLMVATIANLCGLTFLNNYLMGKMPY